MRKAIVLLSSTMLWSVIVAPAAAQEEDPAEEAAEAAEAAEAEAEAAAETAESKGDNLGEEVEGKLGMRQASGGYGPAGCGLGSLIFEPDSGFTQIFAATTNGTFGSQTFGITTGTSNCDTGPSGSANAKAFVAANRAAVAKDIARGSGETLGSLTRLAACENGAAVGPTLQRNFGQIFPDGAVSDHEVGERVLGVLKAHGELGCKHAG